MGLAPAFTTLLLLATRELEAKPKKLERATTLLPPDHDFPEILKIPSKDVGPNELGEFEEEYFDWVEGGRKGEPVPCKQTAVDPLFPSAVCTYEDGVPQGCDYSMV